MPQQIIKSDEQIPPVEFDVRTGKPTGAAKQKPQRIIEISDVKIQKGTWLKNKLLSLYNDPKYKSGTLEQQNDWKNLAYDKWVQPYYKNILKIDPPSKEDWVLNKGVHKEAALTHLDKELKTHTLKATSDIASGIFHNLSYVGKALDFLVGDDERKPGEKNLQQILESGSEFFEERSKEFQEELNVVHGKNEKPSFSKDVPGRLAELGTGAAFFEAEGGTKVVKALNVANPKTAALTFQMAKASWNTAVDFAAWSTSQGEKPEDILESASTGAVLGPAGKVLQRKAFDPLFQMLKTLFKWGGPQVTKEIVTKGVEKALGQTIQSGTLTKDSEKAVEILNKNLDSYSIEKFKRPYKDLPYIQKVHVINRLMSLNADAVASAKAEGMPKQVVQGQAQEVDQQMREIFPEAKASQEKVEQFIKANGEPPQPTKLLASLPHHNTTIDSSWKHLQARASFLKGRLRSLREAGKGSSEEAKDINKALNEEYALMKEKSERQKILESKKSSGGTVGGAAADDPKVFRGDEFIVTPNIDPFRHNFTEWYEDSFAKNVARSAKEQALAKGQKQSFLANAIDNSFLIGSNLAREVRLGFGETKQLLHSQYGVVGGINYEFKKAASLGEKSGLKPSEDILYINFLGMRPNVVSRVWNVPGGGQTLFLNAALEADRRNIGIALIPLDESKSFYEKMGMKEVGSYMVMNKDQVKDLLKNKGLLMMLLGAGVTYGASKELSVGDYSVNSKGTN